MKLGANVKQYKAPWRRGVFNGWSHNGTRAKVFTNHQPRKMIYIKRELLMRDLDSKA